jgi:8-oxo-dGTP diphosphatase
VTKKMRVRALIVNEGAALLIHRRKSDAEYWVFPGGGVEESDESPTAALERECVEELGVQVEVGQLVLEFSEDGSQQNFYRCTIIGGELGSGIGPEHQPGSGYRGSYALEWVPRAEALGIDVRPVEARDLLA